VFSDRGRVLKMAALALLLVAFCAHSQAVFYEPTLAECLSDPAAFDGTVVPVASGATLGPIAADRFRVHSIDGDFSVSVPGGTSGLGLREGDYFYALTVFRNRPGGGELELTAVQTAPLRRMKIAVSALPVLLAAVLLARVLRWRKGAFYVAGEDDA